MPQATDTVGVLLVLKAFASGCSALTGVEAIANSVPQFRLPRARRAQHTEVALGVILGLMLLGLGELIRRWDALPQPGTTVLAQLTSGAIGHGVLFYVIQLITLVLLALAANTSFGGLPGAPRAARAGQLPPARVRAAGGPPGVPLRRRVPRRRRRAAAHRLPRQHPGACPCLRRRRVRRVHALPGRDGAPLVRHPRPRLPPQGGDQRRRGGADVRGDRDRARQQVRSRARGWSRCSSRCSCCCSSSSRGPTTASAPSSGSARCRRRCRSSRPSWSCRCRASRA